MRHRIGSPAAIAALSLAGIVAASAPAPARADDTLTYDTAVDLTITGVAAAAWVASELASGTLAPKECRWCDRNPDGSDALNGLDRSARQALVWSNTGAANSVSNVTGFVVAPVAALGLDALAAVHDDRGKQTWGDWLVIAQATAIAADLNQLVKFTVGRERPFVHVLPPDAKALTDRPSDNNTSFYSGHTSLTFSLAVASGTVASIRGYRLAPAVWSVGLATAALTGYLRIAADKHYLTDVLTGAVVGSGVGFVVPYVFHRGPSPTVSAGLRLVAVSWVW